MESETFNLLACILYLSTVAVLGIRLKHKIMSVGTTASLLWLSALISHGINLSGSVFTLAGINITLLISSSAVALLISLLLWVSCLHKPMTATALLVLPVTAVIVLLSYFEDHQFIIANVSILGIRIHIVSSLLAYSVLVITGIQAIMLSFQDRMLRGQISRRLLRILPPLDAMETFLFNTLILGFMLLTLSLSTGWIYHNDLIEQSLTHKTFFSSLAWLIFAILIMGRLLMGWRSKQTIKFTLIGIILLAIGYSGSRFVVEYLLKRLPY